MLNNSQKLPENPQYLNECKVGIMNDLIEQLSFCEDDWQKIAHKFPDLFKLDDILAIQKEASRHTIDPAQEVVNRLRSAMIPIRVLHDKLKSCELLSACEVLEREILMVSQNTISKQSYNASNSSFEYYESNMSLDERGCGESQNQINKYVQQNQDKFKYDNLIQLYGQYLPTISNDSLNKTMVSVGRFNLVIVEELKLTCLRANIEKVDEYLNELKMMKLKHLNLLTADIMLKDTKITNQFSLLYVIDDRYCQWSLAEYIKNKSIMSQGHDYNPANDTLDKVHILNDIASGLLYLHSKTALKNPILHGNLTKDSILVNFVSNDRILCKINDFRFSREIEIQNDDNILDDFFNLGLIIYSVLTLKNFSKEECLEVHARLNLLEEKSQRLARIELKNSSLPKLNSQIHNDVLTKLFLRYFLTYTSNSNDKHALLKSISDKKSLFYLTDDLVKFENELKSATSIAW